MSIDLARRIGQALNVRNETAIRTINQALEAYVRLTPQSPTTTVPGSIDASQVVSGEFADARIAESNVTQHEAALEITELQITDLGNYGELDQPETVAAKWTFDAGIALGDGDQVEFGANAAIRAGTLSLADDATGIFAVPHFSLIAVKSNFNNDADVVFLSTGQANQSIHTGTAAQLGGAVNPDVDTAANYWKSGNTELSIKNRLGSTRTFSIFVLGRI